MMRTTRILWLGATTVAIGSLLMAHQGERKFSPASARAERRDTTARMDEPDAAARADLARRQPTDGRLDMPRLYEAATRQVASLARFASAINRDLPSAQPASRVWLSGSRVLSLKDPSNAA